jgi:hypothetical protein
MSTHLSLIAQSIVGPTSVCPNTTVRYTFTPTGCAALIWGAVQGPGTVTVVGQAANYIDLRFPQVTSSAPFRLNAGYNCAGLGGNATLDVTVQPPAEISTSSQAISCGFTGIQTFKYGLVGGNHNVTWTTNTGWPIATAPRIYEDRFGVYFYEIQYNVNNINSGFVKLSAAGTTCSNAVDVEHTFNITRTPSNNLPAPVFSERPASQQCVLATNTFSVQPYAGAISYTWTSDLSTTKINGQTPPVTISAADNGNTVTMTEPNKDYVANITVTAQSTCGQTLPATARLTIGYPLGAVKLTGPDEVTAGAIFADYYLQSNPLGLLSGAQSIDWFQIPAGWSILHYLANNTGIEVGVGNQPGYIQLSVKICGVTRGISKYISIGGGSIPPVPPLKMNDAAIKLNVSVYPNPATNNINLVIPEQMQPNAKTAAQKDKLEVTIFDTNGVIQYRERIAATRNTHTIDVSRLLPGAYTIQLLSGTKQGTAKFIRQ